MTEIWILTGNKYHLAAISPQEPRNMSVKKLQEHCGQAFRQGLAVVMIFDPITEQLIH